MIDMSQWLIDVFAPDLSAAVVGVMILVSVVEVLSSFKRWLEV